MTESDTAAAAETAPPDAPPPRHRRALRGLLLALLVLVVATGGMVVAWPRLAPLLGLVPAGPSPAELARQVATLRDELGDTRRRVVQLEARLAVPATPGSPVAADTGLEQRVAAVETALAAKPGLPAHLADDVKAQGERLTALEKNAADAAAVLRLADRLDKVEAGMRELQARRSSAGAVLLAVGQLRQAVDAARPYDGELRALAVLAAKDDETQAELAALKPRAATGIPSQMALASRFTALEPAIVRAELLPEKDGWWRQTLDRLTALVSVRREDGNAVGDNAAAVAARMQARLAEGDLAQAAAEGSRLSGGAAQVAAGWLDDARARVAADQALSRLSAQAIATSSAGQ